MTDDEFLIQCDSILSLIFYREGNALSKETRNDVESLLKHLRKRTDSIVRDIHSGR